MALTKKDLQQIQEIITAQLTVQLTAHLTAQDARIEQRFAEQDARFTLALRQHADDIKRDIRDEMDARFLASEQRFTAKISALDTRITNEIQSLTQVILSFFPERCEALEGDVARLKQHVGMV